MKLFIGLMAAATILVPASPILCQTASAPALDPFTIDDLLSQEGVGNIRISPDSRWVVVERQAPWNTASTYKYDQYTETLLSRLEVFSATDGGRRPCQSVLCFGPRLPRPRWRSADRSSGGAQGERSEPPQRSEGPR